MIKVAMDEAELAKLRPIKERVEICDLEGRIVGYFEPSKYAGMVIPPDPTPEELAEMEKGPWYTTAEVLERLRGLGQ